MMKAFRLLVVAILAAVPGLASAACTVTITAMAFGTYQADQLTPMDASSDVVILCERNNENIFLTMTGGASNNSAARAMVNGAERLSYQLYPDAARTSVVTSFAVTADKNRRESTNFSVFGRVFANQNVGAGNYSDSPVLTLLP